MEATNPVPSLSLNTQAKLTPVNPSKYVSIQRMQIISVNMQASRRE